MSYQTISNPKNLVCLLEQARLPPEVLPPEIFERLKEWAGQPFAGEEQLARWKWNVERWSRIMPQKNQATGGARLKT